MGFPVSWQSKITHDSVVAKQEFDIRLYEAIRRSLIQRAKCDKDYAAALSNSVVQIGMKFDKNDEFSGEIKMTL